MSAPIQPNIPEQPRPEGDCSVLRSELMACIESWGAELPPDFNNRTSLIASGLLDSMALFNLLVWVESKTGRSIDPAFLDIAKEWDSIDRVVGYVQGVNLPSSRATASALESQAEAGTPSGYKITRYNPSYKRAVATFQTGLWSKDPDINLRYLEWKYERNPYRSDPVIYLALYKETIVGMRGFYGSLWEAGTPSRQFPVLVADDMLVHEDHRNRGLVKHLMQTACEELGAARHRYVFNLSGSALTVLSSLAMNWRSVGLLKPLGRLSLSENLHQIVRSRVRQLPWLWRLADLNTRSGTRPFAKLDRASNRRNVENNVPVDIEGLPRPRAMAEFVKRIGHDGRLRHVRDESFFDWRFQNPLHEYRFLYVGDKEAIDGYLVLKRLAKGLTPSVRVSIVDLEATDDRVQAALLRTAVNVGAFEELAVWTATSSLTLLSQLHGLGFRPIDKKLAAFGIPTFLVRHIGDESDTNDWLLGSTNLLNLSNWDTRMIYTMSG